MARSRFRRAGISHVHLVTSIQVRVSQTPKGSAVSRRVEFAEPAQSD